jgi:beta-galactosidase
VAGYNGDGAVISLFQDPGIPNLVSEYGSVTATRPGNYDPGWGQLQTTNNLPTQYPWRSGEAIWCMLDHGSLAGADLETMGIVDYFRIPKRAWYWYRNAYANVPPPTWPSPGTPSGLTLTASTTTLTSADGTQDAWLNVMVVDSKGNPINNTVPVTLTVISGPGEFPTGPSITFQPPSNDPSSDIAILDGQAAVEFRTYYSGTTVITATSPGLANASVTITSQGSPAFVPGQTPPVAPRPYMR